MRQGFRSSRSSSEREEEESNEEKFQWSDERTRPDKPRRDERRTQLATDGAWAEARVRGFRLPKRVEAHAGQAVQPAACVERSGFDEKGQPARVATAPGISPGKSDEFGDGM